MKYGLLILSSFLSFAIQAQEVLYPLGFRPVAENNTRFKKAGIDTLDLPLFDDFSVDKFIGSDIQELWIDRNVYVNNTYPTNQPTAGVATFDGLDDVGYPYDFSDQYSYGIADYLTSAPIDLNYPASDSIYLSFFAQAGVQLNFIGAREKDSLIVEFKNVTTGNWERVWRKPGKGVGSPDNNFEQFLIPIKKSDYLKKGFQFRFLNYSNLASANYLWHIDYIKLDRNRSNNDVAIPDVGYQYAVNNVLSDYSIMPWEMYQQQGASAANFNLSADVYNNATFNKIGINGEVRVKENGVVINSESFGGAVQFNAQSKYVFNYTLANALINPAWTPADLYPAYEINYVLSTTTTPEFSSENDTLRFFQKFGPFLAYDDGTAEQGYGVNVNGGRVAQAYTISQPDTITSVKMYFNPLQLDFSGNNFLVTIWSSVSPEVIATRNNSFSFPAYNNGQNGFIEYDLDSAIIVDGTFYVGYTQTNSARLNVGIDLNTNKSSKIYYNLGNGFVNTSVPGALMIRPVFGNGTVGVAETESLAVVHDPVYPNPAQNVVNIPLSIDVKQVVLFDITGKQILQTNKQTVDVSNMPNGAYFLQIIDNNDAVSTQKIMIQR
jgi:hypothetical protein